MRIVLGLVLLVPGVAAAQDGAVPRFTGLYAGPEVSVQEHGFDIEVSEPAVGFRSEREYGRTGVAAGGFAGFDFAATRRLRVGGEAGATVGGGSGGRADLPGGNRYEQRPRWGWRAVARAGYVLGDRTLVYATLGYGAQRNRIRTSIFIDGVGEWERGVAGGIGVEYRVARAVSLRLDARHVAGASNQLSLGVPIRF
jgi:outer membrane immunogenic protein